MSLRWVRNSSSPDRAAPLADATTGSDRLGTNRVLPLRPGGELAASLSDEALVAACAVGDHGALAILFQRHHRGMHRFCARLVHSAEVDDVVQNTFVAAWTNAQGFRGGASARAWLFAIAANLVRKAHRSEERKRSALALLRLAPSPPSSLLDDQIASRELLSRLEAALARLPHDLRVAFVLCEIEGIPGAEAASALGVRPGTLWRRLHDARKRLLHLVDGGEP